MTKLLVGALLLRLAIMIEQVACAILFVGVVPARYWWLPV